MISCFSISSTASWSHGKVCVLPSAALSIDYALLQTQLEMLLPSSSAVILQFKSSTSGAQLVPCKLSSCECVVRKDWEARKCLHRALWRPLCSASDNENHLDMSRSQQTCRCCISLSHPNYVLLFLMWSPLLFSGKALIQGPSYLKKVTSMSSCWI